MHIRFTGDEVKAILLRAAVEKSIGLDPIPSQTARLASATLHVCGEQISLMVADEVTIIVVPVETRATRVVKPASAA